MELGASSVEALAGNGRYVPAAVAEQYRAVGLAQYGHVPHERCLVYNYCMRSVAYVRRIAA